MYLSLYIVSTCKTSLCTTWIELYHDHKIMFSVHLFVSGNGSLPSRKVQSAPGVGPRGRFAIHPETHTLRAPSPSLPVLPHRSHTDGANTRGATLTRPQTSTHTSETLLWNSLLHLPVRPRGATEDPSGGPAHFIRNTDYCFRDCIHQGRILARILTHSRGANAIFLWTVDSFCKILWTMLLTIGCSCVHIEYSFELNSTTPELKTI